MSRALEHDSCGRLIHQRTGANVGNVVVGAALRVQPVHVGCPDELDDSLPGCVFGLFAGPNGDIADGAMLRCVAQLEESIGVKGAFGGWKAGGSVAQKDRDFPSDIYACVIVIVLFGGSYAIPDKNYFAFGGSLLVGGIAGHQEIFRENEFEVARVAMDHERVAVR